MAKGTVKWFSSEKGFGFITDPEVECDVFVHYSEIRSEGFRTLEKGEAVEYEREVYERGVKAVSVARLLPDQAR